MLAGVTDGILVIVFGILAGVVVGVLAGVTDRILAGVTGLHTGWCN